MRSKISLSNALLLTTVTVAGMVCFFPEHLAAQSDSVPASAMLSEGQTNGYLWQSMNRKEKVRYVVGLQEGMSLCSVRGRDYTATSNGDLVSQIDAFYGDVANLRIPAQYAYDYVAAKMNGATNQQLVQKMAGLRHRWQ